MNTWSVGSKGRRQLELRLEIGAQGALERLRSRVRAERPLALTFGGPGGYVGAFKKGGFRIRRVTNIPRLQAVQAYGSVRDEGEGSVVRVTFRRNSVANAIVWCMRIFLTLLVVAGLVAASKQIVFLTFAIFTAVIGGAVLWNARERESDRRQLREFLFEAFPNASPTAESTDQRARAL